MSKKSAGLGTKFGIFDDVLKRLESMPHQSGGNVLCATLGEKK